MKREFRIPVSRWTPVIFPLTLVIQLFIIAVGVTEFSAAPSVTTGSKPLVWVVIAIGSAIFGVQQLRTANLITIENEAIRVQRVRGKRHWPDVPILSINEDQLAYFLDSKNGEICLSKKSTPPELDEILIEKIRVQKAGEG